MNDVEVDDSFSNQVEFGQAVRRKRRERGCTLSHVANEIGTSTTTISHIESAQNLPGAELLEKICIYFGLSVSKAKRILIDFKTEKAKRRIETNIS